MTQYHFYTGSYLSNVLHYFLSQTKQSDTVMEDWSRLTANSNVEQNTQLIHVLFYESLLKAFRSLYQVCSTKLLDGEIYTILSYSLSSLCAHILQEKHDTARVQRIHFVYSSGDKASLKNSVRNNEQHIAKMVNEMNYRFFMENLVKFYEPKIKSRSVYKKVAEEIMQNEMIPAYQANQCIELMKHCAAQPGLSLEDSDELVFFRFYSINYQAIESEPHYHAHNEEEQMQSFLAQVSKAPISRNTKSAVVMHASAPQTAGYTVSGSVKKSTTTTRDRQYAAKT